MDQLFSELFYTSRTVHNVMMIHFSLIVHKKKEICEFQYFYMDKLDNEVSQSFQKTNLVTTASNYLYSLVEYSNPIRWRAIVVMLSPSLNKPTSSKSKKFSFSTVRLQNRNGEGIQLEPICLPFPSLVATSLFFIGQEQYWKIIVFVQLRCQRSKGFAQNKSRRNFCEVSVLRTCPHYTLQYDDFYTHRYTHRDDFYTQLIIVCLFDLYRFAWFMNRCKFEQSMKLHYRR